jgi:hypothetical protein
MTLFLSDIAHLRTWVGWREEIRDGRKTASVGHRPTQELLRGLAIADRSKDATHLSSGRSEARPSPGAGQRQKKVHHYREIPRRPSSPAALPPAHNRRTQAARKRLRNPHHRKPQGRACRPLAALPLLPREPVELARAAEKLEEAGA